MFRLLGTISNSRPPPNGFADGQTLAGKYLLVRQLGEGGMCVVYEAEHVGLRQGLALKVLRPELAGDPDCVARFEREARAAAQLRSPNVAKVFDVDYLPGGQPYITMELLVGHDLGGELQQSGRLPVPLAVDYVRQACSGIAEAHALGIVHRDLKPENLFLTELGELTDRKLVKILDFGIAKNISDSARRLTAPDAVFGTVDYMSPEQIRSAFKVDHRTDLWSLGVILYELLTGRTPYSGDARAVIAQIVSEPVPPPTDHVPDLPPSLVETVMKALAKDPEARFQSAEELRAALEGYGDFEPITAVIARLPPQSVPRRVVRTAPSLPPNASANANANANAGLLEGARDARTHGSWETKAEARGWGKTWIMMPAIAMVLGAVAGFVYWRSAPRTLAHLAGAATSAPPAAASAALPPASAAASPSGTTSTPSAALATSAAISPTPSAASPEPATPASSLPAPAPVSPVAAPPVAASPVAASPVAASTSGKPARPHGPAARPAAAAPPPAPSAAGAAPRLPKHL